MTSTNPFFQQDGVQHSLYLAFHKWDPELMVGADTPYFDVLTNRHMKITGYAYHLDDFLEGLHLELNGEVVEAEIKINQESLDQTPYHPEAAQRLSSRYEIDVMLPEITNGPLKLIARLAKRGEVEIAASHWRSNLGGLDPVPAIHASAFPDLIRFVIDDDGDVIQGKHHAKGEIYEQHILDFVKDIVPPRSTILDVGANVGNHLLWFHQVMRAELVIPFEPNPVAYHVLLKNVVANGLDRVDLRWLEKIVSSQTESFVKSHSPKGNLGGTRYETGEGVGSLRLDDIVSGARIDLIKIDVEGMEMDVLESANQTIRNSKPVIMVETQPDTAAPLSAWRKENEYLLLHRFCMYRDCWTNILVPDS